MSEAKTFNEVFQNRHTIRHYDPNETVDRDEIKEIIEDSLNTPSAFNLQPWRVVVCDTPEARGKVKDAVVPVNLPQFNSAPVTLFVLGDPNAHNVFREVQKERLLAGKISDEELDKLLHSPFLSVYDKAAPEMLSQSAITGASLLAMSLILNIRNHGYETSCWNGYDEAHIVKALGEEAERFIPVLAISFGKPDESLANEEFDASERYAVEQISKFL